MELISNERLSWALQIDIFYDILTQIIAFRTLVAPRQTQFRQGGEHWVAKQYGFFVHYDLTPFLNVNE